MNRCHEVVKKPDGNVVDMIVLKHLGIFDVYKSSQIYVTKIRRFQRIPSSLLWNGTGEQLCEDICQSIFWGQTATCLSHFETTVLLLLFAKDEQGSLQLAEVEERGFGG